VGYQPADRFKFALPPSALTLCREGGRLRSAGPLRKKFWQMRGGYQPATRIKFALPPSAFTLCREGGRLPRRCLFGRQFWRCEGAISPPIVSSWLCPPMPFTQAGRGPTGAYMHILCGHLFSTFALAQQSMADLHTHLLRSGPSSHPASLQMGGTGANHSRRPRGWG
jgi:hypothetical protein